MSRSRWRLAAFAVLLTGISIPAALACSVYWRYIASRYEIAVVGRVDSVQHRALTYSSTHPNGETWAYLYGTASIVVTETIKGPKDLKRVPVLWMEDLHTVPPDGHTWQSTSQKWYTGGESGVFLLQHAHFDPGHYWFTLLPGDSAEVVRHVLEKYPSNRSMAPASHSGTRGAGTHVEVPADWREFANPGQGYRLFHPPDWEPYALPPDGFLYYFNTPAKERFTFQIHRMSSKSGEKLEAILEDWAPELHQAEGSTYFVDQARRITLGQNEAIEIPMFGSERYQEAMWIVGLGEARYYVVAEIQYEEATVRRILSTLAAIK